MEFVQDFFLPVHLPFRLKDEHWLEARLRNDPDNPELLRAQAHLLVRQGDEGAEKAVRRLEALGVDTPADRSLLSGLRHRAGSPNEAIEAIEQALEEDNQKPDYWLQYALHNKQLCCLENPQHCVDLLVALEGDTAREHLLLWMIRNRLLIEIEDILFGSDGIIGRCFQLQHVIERISSHARNEILMR